MGTRNLTCVILNGEFKVAQYGQWDGYPSGSGKDILEWLSDSAADFDRLKDAANRVVRMRGDYDTQTWIEIGEDNEHARVIPQADFDKYPAFSRDMGSEVLEYIVSAENPVVVLQEDFAQDSLFCEWVYVIDLDSMNFDIYEGFNTEPLSECELFYTGEEPESGRDGNDTYHPVKLVKSYPLNFLPDADEFLADLEPEESE